MKIFIFLNLLNYFICFILKRRKRQPDKNFRKPCSKPERVQVILVKCIPCPGLLVLVKQVLFCVHCVNIALMSLHKATLLTMSNVDGYKRRISFSSFFMRQQTPQSSQNYQLEFGNNFLLEILCIQQ